MPLEPSVFVPALHVLPHTHTHSTAHTHTYCSSHICPHDENVATTYTHTHTYHSTQFRRTPPMHAHTDGSSRGVDPQHIYTPPTHIHSMPQTISHARVHTRPHRHTSYVHLPPHIHTQAAHPRTLSPLRSRPDGATTALETVSVAYVAG